MKNILFILFACYFISYCKSTKIENVNSTEKLPLFLDSLIHVIKPYRHGLYEIDYHGFDITRFDSVTPNELAINFIPLKKDEQKVYMLNKFLERIDTNILSHKYITPHFLDFYIGNPSTVSINSGKMKYEYILNQGYECPNCRAGIWRIFESCDYLRFYFVNGILKDIDYQLYYSGM